MKSIKKAGALFLLVVSVCSLFVCCAGKTPKPEDTILALQKAINSFDVDGILSCVDNEWAEQVENVLAFTVGENGLSIDSYISLAQTILPALPVVTGGKIGPDKLPKIQFSVLKTDVLGETAVVMLAGLLDCGEFERPFAATVDMKIQNGVWVISGVR